MDIVWSSSIESSKKSWELAQQGKLPALRPSRGAGLLGCEMNVIIQSPRDQRVLDWLVQQVGLDAISAACSQLAGGRRPYPSNLAKVLGLTPPESLSLASREVAQAHLDAIYKKLGRTRK